MSANDLQWDSGPGHYEVYYLSLTDPLSATGLWIRHTMCSPLDGPGECALWFMAMDRDGARFARKATHPIEALSAERDPFRLTLAGADLSDRGMAGELDGAAWELSWEPSLPAAEHVDPLLRRTGVAKTILVLAHPDLAVSGTVRFGGRELVLEGARGGQAHLWGSKHASRWTWAHANDLRGAGGEPRPGTYLDGVSVFVERFGRQLGPTTPVVGRFGDDEFRSTSPLSVARNSSRFGPTSWRFEARDGRRRVVGEVDAPRGSLVGVTYHDPDGDLAYCYNSEVASMRANVWDRTSRGRHGWMLRDTLVADGNAHFEYAQRAPVDGVELFGDVSFRADGEHLVIDLPGATAFFTTRRGGVSDGPYASLNVGLLTDDDADRVAANRERVRAHAGADRLAQGRQVHGTRVVVDGEGGEEADGQVTTRAGVAAIVLVADCLPVALAGPGAAGVVHAGWRGLSGGVLEAGVAAVGPSGAVAAAIGPGIGPCCYEVGDDVRAVFGTTGRTLDLKAAARARLQDAGVTEIHDCGLCTACDAERFFSHRRDRGVTGRQAGLAWRS